MPWLVSELITSAYFTAGMAPAISRPQCRILKRSVTAGVLGSLKSPTEQARLVGYYKLDSGLGIPMSKDSCDHHDPLRVVRRVVNAKGG